jgi:hypothetical protein
MPPTLPVSIEGPIDEISESPPDEPFATVATAGVTTRMTEAANLLPERLPLIRKAY